MFGQRGDDAGISPENDPRLKGPNIPSSDDIPSLPKDIRRDAKQISGWTREHLEHSISSREHLERMWIRVESYMEGFHYFVIDRTGQWRPKAVAEGEVRSTVPHMRNIYRRELGRFTENILTVQGFPRSPNNPMAFYEAQRAAVMINAWQEEIDFTDVYEEWISDTLYYGLSALYHYGDPFRQQVFPESWPAWELHPIPWNATRDNELQGFMRAKLMSRDWIEQNLGKQAAEKAGRTSRFGPRVGTAPIGNAIGSTWGGRNHESAEVMWVWLLPSKQIPSGQHYILVEDEMFGYQATDQQGQPITGALSTGKFPFELLRYTKHSNNFYGMSCLASVLGAQAEADRAWSKVVRASRLRDGLMFYKDDAFDTNDLFNYDNQCIPYDEGAYGKPEEFIKIVPPAPLGAEVGATLTISQEMGRQAVGHESDLLRGKAEGRVESGPAARILHVNAQSPIAPTFTRVRRGLKNHFKAVLPKLNEVWPDNKRISVIGQYDLPSELTLTKEGRPDPENVILQPSPLMPAGKMENFNLLLQLRQMAGDDKKPEISSAEFRRGLASIGMNPPGLSIVSKKDQRIRQRVAELFNDGQTPGKFFNDDVERDLIVLEDVEALHDALVEKILDPGFRASASDEVKTAFLEVLKDVRKPLLQGGETDDRFDENLDLEAHDARRAEEFLDGVEQDPNSVDGIMTHQGVPIGA